MGKRTPLKLLSLAACVAALVGMVSLAGCERPQQVRVNFQMGDRIYSGPMNYNVVQTAWKTQLGELFSIRVPKNRFLLITIAATNGGSKELSVPFFSLEAGKGQEYREVEDGTSVENWFGLLRTIQPGETRQGNLLFDVPLTSYRLRLTDGGEPGSEKYIWVDIPLRIDTDTSISVPMPGSR
jgi:hypothetical protein